MLTIKQKFLYLYEGFTRSNEPVICPSCGANYSTQIDSKYLFLKLFECNSCKLYYRFPVEKIDLNKKFYQKEYEEGDSLTTYMPSQSELLELKENNFVTQTDRSAKRLIDIFEALKLKIENCKILDYGASWGYISYQFKNYYKMNVESFEISTPRANYGNDNLDLNIKTNESELHNNNQIFFSSHVIEHVPNVSYMLSLGKKLLLKDGFIVTLCPNGSKEFKQQHPKNFHLGWGKVHPNYLNAAYVKKYFENNPYFIDSYPFDNNALKNWDGISQVIIKTNGWELLFIARPNIIL